MQIPTPPLTAKQKPQMRFNGELVGFMSCADMRIEQNSATCKKITSELTKGLLAVRAEDVKHHAKSEKEFNGSIKRVNSRIDINAGEALLIRSDVREDLATLSATVNAKLNNEDFKTHQLLFYSLQNKTDKYEAQGATLKWVGSVIVVLIGFIGSIFITSLQGDIDKYKGKIEALTELSKSYESELDDLGRRGNDMQNQVNTHISSYNATIGKPPLEDDF